MFYTKFEQKIIDAATKKKSFTVWHVYRALLLIFVFVVVIGINPAMPVLMSKWFSYVGVLGIILVFSFYERKLLEIIAKLKSIINSQEQNRK